MLKLGSHSFTIVSRKESMRQSSEGPWGKSEDVSTQVQIMAGWFLRNEIMLEDMIRIGAYCSEP